ncbi:MAG: HmuY family protein [Treponema sp.]|jgi:hypothetical protein|nr:HmuY family protein [Treponema sp.]
MKHKTFIAGGIALLCAAALLLGCDTTTGSDDDEGKTFSVSVTAGDGTKYFALRSGTAVEVEASDAATTNWDIAFKRLRLILTNSGDTNAGGQGGVWHTNSTDFESVTLSNKQNDYVVNSVNYSTDVTRHIPGMGGGSNPVSLNVMTYLGYTGGTGSDSDPFTAPNLNNQKQYYVGGHMGDTGPVFTPSYQVYIIKLGDGSGFAKIQVVEYSYGGSPTADNFVVKYKLLD